MQFNLHRNLVGQHAFLSASKYHWINYDEDKLADVYTKAMAAQKGTELHDFAATCIKLGQKLPASKKTLNMYVNDAIGFRMTPEQPLFYSENCFGTADTIFYGKNTLRIHDYKSGETPASMHQLEIYAALFFLEYNVKPEDTRTILRIYQMNDFIEGEPGPEIILPIMDKIKRFDNLISKIKEESN